MSPTQTGSHLAVTTPAGDDVLILRGFNGQEGLSMPFHFTLEMVSTQSDVDFSKIVGKAATVQVIGASDSTRYISGLITRFVHAGTTSRFTHYIADLRPWFWMLTLTSDRRIYQTKSAVDIVKAIFDELGFTDYKDSTTGTYTARDYCVQYGETAFDFVSRLLDEEGIHYYFEHEDGKHTLVLADDADAHQPIEGPTAIMYKTSGAMIEDADVVTRAQFEQHVVTGKYTVDDYEFTTPATDLVTTATGTDGTLEMHEYPAGHSKKDAGDAIAKIRIEAAEVEGKVLSGASTVRNFTPGCTFSLTDHERAEVNQKYLIRSVTHMATIDEYTNSFDAIPATVPYRPRSGAPKPRIYSAQTAVVVGKSGEEIYTDKYGRIKVQFHWDRKGTNDENSSCWVRVAQGWAGKSWGTMFTPRVGMEVIISFLDGDPDRPICTGTVYNATQVLPYTLPDEATKSTTKTNSSKGGGGFNEIRFEDKKDSEELFIQAQKDMKVDVLNDRTTTVKNNDTTTVTKDRAVTVSEGNDTYTVSKGKRTLAVTEGDEAHTVGGKRGVDVTGDEKHTNAAKFTHEVTGDYTLKISGNLTIESSGSISIKSGTTFANEAGTALSSKAGTDLSIEATAGLKAKGATVATEASTTLTNKGVSITNDASAELNNKSGGMQTVQAGAILTVKGAMVKIN